MAYETIILDKKDKIAHLILNQPEMHNRLTAQCEKEIQDALSAVEVDPEVSVVILKANGEDFCSGHQLGTTTRHVYAAEDPLMVMRWRDFRDSFQYRRMWEIPQPIIAQVHGEAYLAGCKLAMNCDLVIAADDAQFSYRPVSGVSRAEHLWPWLIGMRKTKELLFTGAKVSGTEAAEMGMINKAVPKERLEDEAEELAKRIARVPLNLLALQKQSVNKCYEAMGLRSAIDYTVELHMLGHALESQKDLLALLRKDPSAGLHAKDDMFDLP